MSERTMLKVSGVLFCILAVSNFTKPLEYQPNLGFVFFGMRQHGTPNLILGPLFGLYLMIYGIAVLRMKKTALPMSYLYAAYVIINLTLFTFRMSGEALAKPIFGLVYIIVAVGVSSGGAYLLSKHRDELT